MEKTIKDVKSKANWWFFNVNHFEGHFSLLFIVNISTQSKKYILILSKKTKLNRRKTEYEEQLNLVTISANEPLLFAF